ncbi:MAG: hypothetical protein RQ824_10515 [bacterium]|nr:hypothetical protein [bacterium]
MVNKKNLLALLVLIVAAGGVFYIYQQSDEKKIEKRFARLSELFSKDDLEPALLMATKVKGIGSLFAKNCIIESSDRLRSGNYSPEQITSHAASARALFRTLKLEFYDVEIALSGDGKAATTVTGMISGLSKQGETFNETYEMEVDLVKLEEDWFFSAIRMVEVLKK